MKGLLLSIVSLLVTLVLLEGVLRLTTDMKQIRFICHYPILDNQYCKSVTAVHGSGTQIVTNSHGLLDKEYSLERMPETLQVAVLGDFFVAGQEIEFGFTFHELWEERLPAILGASVEILNFGVSGIGTWKQLQTFHLRVRAFKPDVTALAFFWGNDLSDALTNSRKGGANPLLDEYPVNSWFQRIQVQRKRFNQKLWNHSSLYQFVHGSYSRLKPYVKSLFDPAYRMPTYTPTTKTLSDRETNTTKGEGEQVRIRNLLPPIPKTDTPSIFDDPYFMDSESWQLCKKLILKLRDEVEAAGGSLVVIHFLALQHYLERRWLPTDEFNTFLNQNSIAFIDPNPFFRALSPGKLSSLYLPDDIHLNKEGHAFLARVTLDGIASEINKLNPPTRRNTAAQ